MFPSPPAFDRRPPLTSTDVFRQDLSLLYYFDPIIVIYFWIWDVRTELLNGFQFPRRFVEVNVREGTHSASFYLNFHSPNGLDGVFTLRKWNDVARLISSRDIFSSTQRWCLWIRTIQKKKKKSYLLFAYTGRRKSKNKSGDKNTMYTCTTRTFIVLFFFYLFFFRV